jgi:SHS2 domain-containing protein
LKSNAVISLVQRRFSRDSLRRFQVFTRSGCCLVIETCRRRQSPYFSFSFGTVYLKWHCAKRGISLAQERNQAVFKNVSWIGSMKKSRQESLCRMNFSKMLPAPTSRFAPGEKNLETTFVEAGDALMNVMVEELGSIETREERRIQLENQALNILLFEILQSLIYFKDSERLLLRPRMLKVTEEDSRLSLDATAGDEPMDFRRHLFRADVKAVTLHRFRLEKSDEGWKAFVIVDV